MLYDNTQLARVYLHARQVMGNEFDRTIVKEILDYIVREKTDPAGGFGSMQDAGSEGEEGKFFVWTRDEVREVLGYEAEAFMAAYGVTYKATSKARTFLNSLVTRSSALSWRTLAASCLRSARSESIPGGMKRC